MEKEDQKIHFDEPMGMMAIVAAVMADSITLAFIFALGIPVVGIIFTFYGIALHYVAAILVGFLLWGKFKGVLTKILVPIIWLLPGPTVTIGIFVGRVLSHKAIRMVVEQAVIVAVGAATGGTGAVAAKGAQVAARGAQVAARGAQAGAQVAGRAAAVGEQAALRGGEQLAARGAEQAAARGAQAAGKAVETGGQAVKQKAEQSFSEKLKEKAEQKIKEKLEQKPEELAKKAFEKMEEMSDDEEEGDESEELVDLSERE